MTLYNLNGHREIGRRAEIGYMPDPAGETQVDVATAVREFLTLALWIGSALGLLVLGYGIIG